MKRRPAFTLLECTVAIIILTTVLVTVSQTVLLSMRQGRAAEQLLMANQEAANQMEQIVARPFAEWTDELAASRELSSEFRQALPTASLSVAIAAEDDPTAKRVQIEISWLAKSGEQRAPIRLVAWKFLDQEEQP